MEIKKSYKIRLYPTKSQKVFFNKTMGACRVVYNELLYTLQENYKNGIKIEKYDVFKQIKEKYIWMKDVDSNALLCSYRDLESAYNNFFSKRTKFPKFKQKKDKNTYRNGRSKIKIKNIIKENKIKLSKIGLVNFKSNYDFSSLNIKKIYNITVERSKTNKYYASICCDVEIKEYEHTGEVIGIDLGIKDLVIDSNSKKYKNPKYYHKVENKIKHLQKLYSKKVKGSKNQEKTRLKLATAYEKLSNKRKDYLHKFTTKLIKENDIICIENLSVKNMTKNHKLAKAIQDASFGTLVSILKYKATWNNRKILEIDRFFPSSKTCHCCGYIKTNLTLKDREWDCPNCGKHLDRDVNAAINIKNEGLRLLDKSTVEVTETGVKTPMLVENPTMDERLLDLKSSDSMKQEQLI
jgi:putative transposase